LAEQRAKWENGKAKKGKEKGKKLDQ